MATHSPGAGRTLLREHIQHCYGRAAQEFLSAYPEARALQGELDPDAWNALQEVQEETFLVHAHRLCRQDAPESAVSDDARFDEHLREIAAAGEDCEAYVLDHWRVAHAFLLRPSLLRRAAALIRPQFEALIRTLDCTAEPAAANPRGTVPGSPRG